MKIEVQGKGGHGAAPHLTVDSLIVGCQLSLNMQQIVSRRVNPLQPAVVTVGTFNAGQAFNIIAVSTKITGTVRTFDEKVRDFIEESIGQIAASTCEVAGATVKYEYIRGYPVVRNHPEVCGRCRERSFLSEEETRKSARHTPTIIQNLMWTSARC